MTKYFIPKLRNYYNNNTGYMQIVVNERDQIIDTAGNTYIDGGDLKIKSGNRKIKIIISGNKFCADYWKNDKLNPLSDIESAPTMNNMTLEGVKYTCDLTHEIYNNSNWNNTDNLNNNPIEPVFLRKFALYGSTNNGGTTGNLYNSLAINYNQKKYGNSTGDGEKLIMFYNGSSEATVEVGALTGEWTFASSTQYHRFNCDTWLIPFNRSEKSSNINFLDKILNSTQLRYFYTNSNFEQMPQFYNGHDTLSGTLRVYKLDEGDFIDILVPPKTAVNIPKTTTANHTMLLKWLNANPVGTDNNRIIPTKTLENKVDIELQEDSIIGKKLWKIDIPEQTITCSANTYKDCVNSSLVADVNGLSTYKIWRYVAEMTLPSGEVRTFDSANVNNAELTDNNYLVFFYTGAFTSTKNAITGTIGSVVAGNYKWKATLYVMFT